MYRKVFCPWYVFWVLSLILTSMAHVKDPDLLCWWKFDETFGVIAGADCIGTEVIGNKLYRGPPKADFVSGTRKPAVVEDNKALPLGDAPRPEPHFATPCKMGTRPNSKEPSIYEWQHKQKCKNKK